MALSEEQIAIILRNKLGHGDFTLREHELKELGDIGMMGKYYKLLCVVENKHGSVTEEKHAFFVKGIANLGKLVMDFPQQVFKKECVMYSAIAQMDMPLINEAVPKCYYSDASHLVLEDLAEARYEVSEMRRFTSYEEVRAILKTLAGLHAGTIIYEERQRRKTCKFQSVYEEFPNAFRECHLDRSLYGLGQYYTAVEKGLLTAADVFQVDTLTNGKSFKEEIKRLWLEFEWGTRPSRRYRNAICQCDLWAANIFMRHENGGVHVKIIDYQMVRYLPPAFDVLEALLLHTTREFRAQFMVELQREYFDTFCDNLRKKGVQPDMVYTFAQFMDSFKEIELFAVVLACITIPMVCVPQEQFAELFTGDVRGDIVLQDRSPLMTAFQDDEYYMSRVRDTILDFKDYLERN